MRNRARGPEGLDPIAPHAPWSGWGFYSKSYKLPGTLEPENEMIGILFKKKRNKKNLFCMHANIFRGRVMMSTTYLKMHQKLRRIEGWVEGQTDGQVRD